MKKIIFSFLLFTITVFAYAQRPIKKSINKAVSQAEQNSVTSQDSLKKGGVSNKSTQKKEAVITDYLI